MTFAFAGVMALVLAGTGLFLYLRLQTELDKSVDAGLRSRAGELGTLARQAESGLAEAGRSPLTEQGESFAQILDPVGEVVDATPRLRTMPLLRRTDIRRASESTVTVERVSPFERDESVRLLATPVDAQAGRLVLVVGASLDDNHEALASLAFLLVIGGSAALLLASLAGVASAALRPVEAMRSKAAAITEHAPGERLPVPGAQDEIGRLGATLNAMLARLEDALARERTFVADAGHELRTPLAILKTELELALRPGRSSQELHEAIRSAAEETDRLAQLSEDLLVIARSQDGSLPITRAPVEPADLLAAVARRFETRARHAGRKLVVEAARGAEISGDRPRLEQALANLMENALRHGDGAVRLSAESSGGRVELHVRDEGPGFPNEFLPQAFERFTRADRARGRGGTGLGLAITQAIARAHGGEAHAANAAEGGADAWIDLPSVPGS